MNISINITYVSGTRVELVVPLEEPCQIVSEPESPATPVQPAQDLADAMAGIPVLTDEERELLKPSGRTMSLYDITYVTQDGKEWKVPPGLMKDLIIIYGEKTVEQELWKAHAWIEADIHRRKTARGMGRFLNGWLSRASSMVRTPIKTLLKRDSLMTNGNAQESW